MRTDQRPTIHRTIGLQYLCVCLGLGSWQVTERVDWRPDWFFVPGAIAVFLLGLDVVRIFFRNRVTGGAVPGWYCAGAAVYCLALMGFDPFANVGGNAVMMFSVLSLILPLLLAMKCLVQRRAWTGVGGLVLFTGTAIACLFYNAIRLRSGLGFFTIRVD